jgi:NADPH2:quinone reductase
MRLLAHMREPRNREPRNRVVQVRRFGGPEGLEVVDAPLPTAGRGEVRVRVLASSVQYTDVLIRRHLYPQTAARRPPFVLGYDLVGEIDQLGDGVSGLQLGDRVAELQRSWPKFFWTPAQRIRVGRGAMNTGA